ncbi:MAG: zinc ribbon domain-containing protein [Faecalibacterium sp.]
MDLNKIMEMGLEYAEKSKNAALDLAEKGKTQAKILNEQAKLIKAQRQLGALVYNLSKGSEENQPLVNKYIEMMDSIEQKIVRLKASLTPAEVEEVERAEAAAAGEEIPVEPVAEEEPAAAPVPKTCPQCGAAVAEDALFCNKCGAQL